MRRAGHIVMLALLFWAASQVVGPILARPARPVPRGGCQVVNLQVVCWEGDPPAIAEARR
ncbi:MAG: hypothetical protein QN174_07600 [Armatimonadota bacterium]|nr:hypothetical protein [Armatimonadota bacterium]